MKPPLKARFPILTLLAVFSMCFLFSPRVEAKGKKQEWTPVSELKPGDKVCLWDIHSTDPLVDKKSPDSLKYWYKVPNDDNARAVYQMRPVTKGLLLRILHPGVAVNIQDQQGPWLSFQAVVIKGGYKKLTGKARPVRKGETTLMREKGQTWPVDWQFISFENARVRKKGVVFNCERKYPKFNFAE